MKLLHGLQFSLALLALEVCVLGYGLAQPSPDAPHPAASLVFPVSTGAIAPTRAFPGLRLTSGLELTYVGMFSPDAVYRSAQVFHGRVAGEGIPPAASSAGNQPSEAPPWMLLTTERAMENLEPPAHDKGALAVQSRSGAWRNHFVTYLYGRASVLYAPLHITTDSHQRLVVSDPKASAIHVLDRNGKTSFLLMMGKGYRLHESAGIAVDASDNIYVADPEHGMIVVFDRSGNFLRYLGSYDGEPEYARPEGLAIDRLEQHLFLVDTPRNLVFELDLQGRELKRAGKNRNGIGTAEFEFPTEIAVNPKHVFVLDRWGTRVQVFDLSLNYESTFDVSPRQEPRPDPDNGLCADEDSNVYVSSLRGSLVRVYNAGGKLLASLGKPGTRAGEFEAPEGLWIDSADRLYVADSGNARVQLFQLKAEH